MDNKRPLDCTRLVVVLLWASLAIIQIQRLSANHVPCENTVECPDVSEEDSAESCKCNQYHNSVNGSCLDCARCCELDQVQIEPCHRDSNTVCSQCRTGKQFYNSETSECEDCITCKVDEQETTKCSIHENRQCQPRCQEYQYYIEAEDRCQFDCGVCQYSCVETGDPRCNCQPAECYAVTDLTCQHNICSTTSVSTSDLPSTVDNESNDLPTWGIGLISIAVVIGIVAFSAGSMILSFCTRRKNRSDDEEQTREQVMRDSDKPVLMGRYINGQPSPFVYPNHYKHHHNHHHHHSSGDSHRKYGHLSNTSRTNSPKALCSPRTDNATPI